MKTVYYITRNEYREDGNDHSLIAIHETLAGGALHLHQLVIDEREKYMEELENEDVEEAWHEDPDGTMDWHIWEPCGYNELFLHLFAKELLD